MEGEIKNLMKVILSISTSLCYCYFISSNVPKGKFRLLSLLPIISFFTILPHFPSYLFPRAVTSLLISWLANFKLLLFAFDHGPLSCHPPKNLIQFMVIACLPIKTKENKNYPSSRDPQQPQISHSNPPKLPLNWPSKIFLFAAFVGAHDFKDHVPSNLVLVLYCCMAYLLVDIIFGVCNVIVHKVLGMELDPPSDEPYFSTSLQDFWGRRWNLMVTNALRHTIYKPVRASLGGVLGQWTPLPALLLVFLVSGLMHELLFYYVTRESPTWEVTCFFVLQGVCLVLELVLKRLLAGKFWLHWAISGPLTVGFVVVTGMWLFFPPVVRTGAADRAIGECKMLLDVVRGRLQ